MDFRTLRTAMEKKGYSFSESWIPYSMDVCDYLRRHDVVFRSPMLKGFEGFPIGNGNIAAMVWNSDEALEMQINKNDLWVYPDENNFLNLCAAGQLKLDFGMPVFNQLFLDDFEGRMRLSDATAVFAAETPFAKVDTRLFIDSDSNVLVIEVSGEVQEKTTLRLSMERYGSRSYTRWDCVLRGDAASCLGKARAEAKDGVISVFEPFDETGKLSCAMAAACLQDSKVSLVSGRRAEIAMEVEGSFRRTLVVATVSSLDDEDPMAKAISLVKDAADVSVLRARTTAWWREYWNRSFVHMTKKDDAASFDYLENLYYIQNYVMGVSSRGKYLAIFNGALCVWNHDIRQWVNPHHWNIQQAYWSLEQANRPELMAPYLETYSRIIPQAQAHAKKMFNSDNGLAITEMHDFEGRMQGYPNTMTPAMQIAIHYLRDVAFPFISRCASLYSDYATFDEKTGKYNIGPAMPAECAPYHNLFNTSVDATMSRYILPVALKAAEILGIESEQTAAWKKLYDNLFDFAYVMDYSEENKSVEMLSIGFLPDEKDPSKPGLMIGPSHGFARTIGPIMPAGIIGLKDKDTRLFKSVRYACSQLSKSALAITPTAIVWARVGEGDNAFSTLFDSIDCLQHFPQGMYYNIDHWSWYSRDVVRDNLRWSKNELALPFYQRDYVYDQQSVYPAVNEYNNGIVRTFRRQTQPYAQCGLETAGIMTDAYQEIAMQSYEGVIRLFPSESENCEGLFTLKAVGGFMVSGARNADGVAPFAVVRSLLGEKCVIDAPFAGLSVCTADGTEVAYAIDQDGFVTFDTEKDTTYILWGADLTEDAIPSAQFDMTINADWKSFRNAFLGRERMF